LIDGLATLRGCLKVDVVLRKRSSAILLRRDEHNRPGSSAFEIQGSEFGPSAINETGACSRLAKAPIKAYRERRIVSENREVKTPLAAEKIALDVGANE